MFDSGWGKAAVRVVAAGGHLGGNGATARARRRPPRSNLALLLTVPSKWRPTRYARWP